MASQGHRLAKLMNLDMAENGSCQALDDNNSDHVPDSDSVSREDPISNSFCLLFLGP